MMRVAFLVPLLVVAILAGGAGFLVARTLAPVPQRALVSAIELPATPTPTPSPTPEPTATPNIRVRTGTGSGGSDSCPVGCSCQHPPNGIIIQCGGR